jgi:ubiquinone/menaquinone biosynthesis C-methylase UbiE
MGSYYKEKLSSLRLKQCYDIAPVRVQHYLRAEIDYVLRVIKRDHRILELGCGYGRVISRLAEKTRWAVGIDTSLESLLFGNATDPKMADCSLAVMNGVRLGFGSDSFDAVVCIQNGISAFHVDQRELIREAVRVTKPGGLLLFSSYSERFWEDRLIWFQMQAEAGLLGEIDTEKTKDGVIVCKDGFTAATVNPEQFRLLTSGFPCEMKLFEIDGSSLFCQLTKKHPVG